MKNNNFIHLTLLASALALSPLVATTINTTAQSKVNTTFSSIANILHRRGLDEESAIKISQKFMNEQDEMFFSMINNLEKGCSILSKEEILEYISSLALRQESLRLDTYSFLVGMTYEIKKRPLHQETLRELQNIATKNTIIS